MLKNSTRFRAFVMCDSCGQSFAPQQRTSSDGTHGPLKKGGREVTDATEAVARETCSILDRFHGPMPTRVFVVLKRPPSAYRAHEARKRPVKIPDNLLPTRRAKLLAGLRLSYAPRQRAKCRPAVRPFAASQFATGPSDGRRAIGD